MPPRHQVIGVGFSGDKLGGLRVLAGTENRDLLSGLWTSRSLSPETADPVNYFDFVTKSEQGLEEMCRDFRGALNRCPAARGLSGVHWRDSSADGELPCHRELTTAFH